MKQQYVGLDVSLEQTSVCVVDNAGIRSRIASPDLLPTDFVQIPMMSPADSEMMSPGDTR